MTVLYEASDGKGPYGGHPLLAMGDMAQQELERLQRLASTFGVEILGENWVRIIKP